MADELETQLAVIHEVKERHEAELMSLPNVVGVGVGYKDTGGETTDRLAVIVYVRRKYAASGLRKAEMVRETLPVTATSPVPPLPDGSGPMTLELEGGEVPTDVKEVGDILALAYTARVRPAVPGYSIGHYAITAGTFGCLVRDTCRPCAVYILSNNHVLANSNAAAIGDPILQPGAYDGGVYPKDLIARLSRFVPVHFGSPARYNLVDCALARPLDQRDVIASIVGLGIPKGTVEATLGMEVAKSGRTTQTSAGKVIDVNATVAVNYGVGVGYFRNQILTTNMSAGGDSGSLLMSRAERKATGLLFAGSSAVTVHNHIKNVEMALGVQIVTA
ncbi:MAG TPA: hypothetical protein VKB31_03095 [Trueperaceae bacterium]|nr:hypothetical protein [Trueperaceae bacterium]